MVEITSELLLLSLVELTHSFLMHVLIWLICLDIVTGYAKAIKLRRLDSKTGTNGIIRHFIVILIMTLVGVYTRVLGMAFLSYILCVFFISNYGLSLAENLDAIGLEMPKAIRPFFYQMREESDRQFSNKLKVETVEIRERCKEDDEQ